jgi:hypothetical protein
MREAGESVVTVEIVSGLAGLDALSDGDGLVGRKLCCLWTRGRKSGVMCVVKRRVMSCRWSRERVKCNQGILSATKQSGG